DDRPIHGARCLFCYKEEAGTNAPRPARGAPMPTLASAAVPDSLADLLPVAQSAEGFEPVAEALRAGRSGAVDGAWGSAAALAVAALARTAAGPVLVVLAHPGDLDA